MGEGARLRPSETWEILLTLTQLVVDDRRDKREPSPRDTVNIFGFVKGGGHAQVHKPLLLLRQFLGLFIGGITEIGTEVGLSSQQISPSQATPAM